MKTANLERHRPPNHPLTEILDLHPDAGLVPEMAPDEWEPFLEDVRRRGIVEPLHVIYTGERYQVVDGRHRLRAAQELGFPRVPVVHIWMEEGETVVSYMLRAALLRRHLSDDQRAALAEEIRQALSRDARAEQLARARAAKAVSPPASEPEEAGLWCPDCGGEMSADGCTWCAEQDEDTYPPAPSPRPSRPGPASPADAARPDLVDLEVVPDDWGVEETPATLAPLEDLAPTRKAPKPKPTRDTRREAAEAVGLPPETGKVRKAQRLAREAPDLFRQVKSGDMKLREAERELKERQAAAATEEEPEAAECVEPQAPDPALVETYRVIQRRLHYDDSREGAGYYATVGRWKLRVDAEIRRLHELLAEAESILGDHRTRIPVWLEVRSQILLAAAIQAQEAASEADLTPRAPVPLSAEEAIVDGLRQGLSKSEADLAALRRLNYESAREYDHGTHCIETAWQNLKRKGAVQKERGRWRAVEGVDLAVEPPLPTWEPGDDVPDAYDHLEDGLTPEEVEA